MKKLISFLAIMLLTVSVFGTDVRSYDYTGVFDGKPHYYGTIEIEDGTTVTMVFDQDKSKETIFSPFDSLQIAHPCPLDLSQIAADQVLSHTWHVQNTFLLLPAKKINCSWKS
jgi:hypothetical protein